MQKKWIALFLALSLLLALTGCGKKKNQVPEGTRYNFDESPLLTESVQYDPLPQENEAWDDAQTEAPTTAPTVAETTEATEAPTTAPTEPKEDPNMEKVNELVYVVGRVNVRNGAGFNSKVIGQLKGGDQVTRTGKGKNGWSQIIYNNQTAYVANNYLTTDSLEEMDGATFEEVNQTVRATDKVNIRSGPSVDFDVIGQLKAGEEVTRTAIGDKGWSRIEYGGQKCYVSNSYLRTVHVNKVTSEKTEATEATADNGALG